MVAVVFGLLKNNFMFQKIANTLAPNLKCREEWLRDKIKAIPSGQKILDAGAGELKYRHFCSHLEYTSQDFGGYNGVGNSEGLQMKKWDNSQLDIVSDIVDIPRDNGSFDAIMCVEVFEHIPEPIKALQEFSRILKPGGKLILTAPFASLTHFAPYFFYTGYSKYWYEKFLTENNFTIKEIVFNGNYFYYMSQELMRLPRIVLDFLEINIFFKYLIILLLLPWLFFLILIFSCLAKIDKKSNEVLSFGLQILAEKK